MEVGIEGRHNVAIVRADAHVREARHTAWHLRLGEEAHQADHGQAAVVHLSDQSLGLFLSCHRLLEVERVEQVERHRVRQLIESGKVARLAAAHVVRLAVLLEHERVLACKESSTRTHVVSRDALGLRNLIWLKRICQTATKRSKSLSARTPTYAVHPRNRMRGVACNGVVRGEVRPHVDCVM